MPKAYSYIRMSTLDQRDGDSTRRQLAATHDYVAAHGLDLADIIQDIGVSAFRGKNAEFGALAGFLEAVSDGLVAKGSYLIVESLDRISRSNIFEAMNLLNKIVERDIVVVTLHDRQHYSKQSLAENPVGMMIPVMIMLRAHEESKTKSIRLSAAWGQKKIEARRGTLTGQRLPSWLEYNADKTEISVQRERAQTVRNMFERSRDGWGAYSIARWLNQLGMPPWGSKSRHWGESYVKKVLNNRSVLGEYQPFKKVEIDGKVVRLPDGDSIPDYYPAIISPDLFTLSHAAIAARKVSGSGRKGLKVANLFSGLMQCAHCGAGIRFINKGQGPKGGRYLRCSSAALASGCDANAFRYEVVEEALLQAIEDIDIAFLLGGPRTASVVAERREQITSVERAIADVTARLQNLGEAVATGGSSLQTLLALMRDEEARLHDSRGRKAELEHEIADLTSDPAAQQERLSAILNQVQSQDIEHAEQARRALAQEIRRLLRSIKLRGVARFPYEFRLDPDLWPEAVTLTETELSERCSRYPFDLQLHYRNGDVLPFDPLTNQRMRIREGEHMRIMRQEQALNERIKRLHT